MPEPGEDKDDSESQPSLEEALDGLQAAEQYCFAHGLDDLGHDVAELYQAVGQQAPEDDWESP